MSDKPRSILERDWPYPLSAEELNDCDADKRIAELEAEVRRLQNNEVNDCDLLGMHERRIAELEAERDQLLSDLSDVGAVKNEVINDRDAALRERDAIRAKTIEDVAKYWEAQDCWDIAKEIQALAQTDEEKT